MTGYAHHLIVLSGVSGAGKTTLCLQLVAQAQAARLRVGGLLTLPRRADGRVTGLDVQDARSGRQRALADVNAQAPISEPASVIVGTWRFRSESLAWGSAVLRSAIPCDLLVVDELGPLELLRGQGWTVALDVIRIGLFQQAVVVVRPSLVMQFAHLAGIADPEVLMLTEANRDAIGSRLWARTQAGRMDSTMSYR